MYFTIYKAKNGQWRWRLFGVNHKMIATSGGDGYRNKKDCRAGIALVTTTDQFTPIFLGNRNRRKEGTLVLDVPDPEYTEPPEPVK